MTRLTPSLLLRRSFASHAPHHAALLDLAPSDLWPWDVVSREPSFRSFSWRILPSEAWSIIGHHAGSLVQAALQGRASSEPLDARQWPFLRNRIVSPDRAIKSVAFHAALASGGFSDWTARYGALRDEDRMTLRDHLRSKTSDEEHLGETCTALNLVDLLNVPLITLSNGQTRRMRIATAILERPEVLVLQEPFAGLDAQSRISLDGHLRRLHEARNPSILLTCRAQDGVPDWTTHVIELAPDRSIVYQGPRDGWRPTVAPATIRRAATVEATGEKIVELDGVTIAGARPILNDLSWTIRAGERWALKGSNGSGKSTTLGLISGDHPQSYSAPVTLFGRHRSTFATSTLQQHIGFVSPELNRAFPRSAGLTAREAIATGFESVYSYRRISAEQSSQLDQLVAEFDLPDVLTPDLLRRHFGELTGGQQALILFLRALVRRPDLLILDEPFASMDDRTIQACRNYVDRHLQPHQAVIVVSHYEEEIPQSVNRVLRLEAGRVIGV